MKAARFVRDPRIAQYRKSSLYKHVDLLLRRHLSSPAKYLRRIRVEPLLLQATENGSELTFNTA